MPNGIPISKPKATKKALSLSANVSPDSLRFKDLLGFAPGSGRPSRHPAQTVAAEWRERGEGGAGFIITIEAGYRAKI